MVTRHHGSGQSGVGDRGVGAGVELGGHDGHVLIVKEGGLAGGATHE